MYLYISLLLVITLGRFVKISFFMIFIFISILKNEDKFNKLYVLSIIRLLPSKLLIFFNFFFDKPIVFII